MTRKKVAEKVLAKKRGEVKKGKTPSKHHSKASPRVVETRAKRLEALELRKRGMTYRQIATQMGCHVGTAHQWVGMAFDELITAVNETAETVRQMELDRLDTMQEAVWGDCLSGDKSAITTMLRVMERRSKLLGLDTPQEVDQTVRILMDNIDKGLAGDDITNLPQDG